jgi:hypothetical protein
MDLDDLSKPERTLWAAFPTGALVDLRSGDPDEDDPVNAGGWSADRLVRAEVVMALLLGDLEKGCAPAIRLVGARISGRLDVMAAMISHALVLSRCRLDEAPRFVEATTRTVRISDCHLPGFDGSRMRTEGILDFHRSVIEEQLCLDRAQVRLQGARIAGQLTFQNAVLDGTGTALYLTRLQADELRLLTARPIRGAIRLAQARVAALNENAAVWPAEIWLNGFTYDVIRHRTGRVAVAERIDWVSRGPFGYQPQPYEQLANFNRRAGYDDDVRRVLLAKQRHRRTTLSAPSRAVGRLLDVTVDYGYRPWLAGIWLALLLAVGTTVYALHHPHPLPGGPVPPFNPFIYTLDLLIPIGAFGLRDAYASTGTAQWLADALIATGWILATAVIAGITRTVRRDQPPHSPTHRNASAPTYRTRWPEVEARRNSRPLMAKLSAACSLQPPRRMQGTVDDDHSVTPDAV